MRIWFGILGLSAVLWACVLAKSIYSHQRSVYAPQQEERDTVKMVRQKLIESHGLDEITLSKRTLDRVTFLAGSQLARAERGDMLRLIDCGVIVALSFSLLFVLARMRERKPMESNTRQ